MYSLIAISLGFLLDLLFGDPYFMPHPIRYIGKGISKFEKIIRKESDGEKAKKAKGFLIAIFIPAFVFIFYTILLKFIYNLNLIFGIVCESFVIYQMLATKCLKDESMKVYNAIVSGDMEKAKLQISYLVTRDTKEMSEEDIVKATVETVSENIVDGIVSPLFFAVIGGAPLGMFYKAVNTLDSMVGYKNKKYFDFGMASAKFDDILNFVPARLTGIMIPLVSMILGLDFKNSFRIMIRDRRNHSSPNSPFSEAAVAGALGIQLGGKATYFGITSLKPTMGDKINEITVKSIKDANNIMYGTSFAALIIFGFIKYIILF